MFPSCATKSSVQWYGSHKWFGDRANGSAIVDDDVNNTSSDGVNYNIFEHGLSCIYKQRGNDGIIKAFGVK